MYHPIWIDLKGQDSVPETVHHVVSMASFWEYVCVAISVMQLLSALKVCKVDPVMDTQWHTLKKHIATDGIHQRDTVRPGMKSKGFLHS